MFALRALGLDVDPARNAFLTVMKWSPSMSSLNPSAFSSVRACSKGMFASDRPLRMRSNGGVVLIRLEGLPPESKARIVSRAINARRECVIYVR